MTLHPLDDMKSYVGFKVEDEANLHQAWQGIADLKGPIIDHFYERVLSSEGARSVLEDDEQVERLKRTLRQWLEELFSSSKDTAYFERRERIGHRHVQVGLHSRYMFTAMSVIHEDVCAAVRERFSPEDADRLCASIRRAVNIDLAIMTGTYVASREERQLSALQELLVGHLRTTVLLVNDQGHVTAATRPATRLFGDDVLLGMSWLDAIPADLMEAGGLDVAVERALETGRELTMPRVDVEADQPRSYRVHVIPLDHSLARFLLQIEELTDAVRMEARLQRSEALAQLGALSAAVAHELRNPLAGISAAIQVIRRGMQETDPHGRVLAKVSDEIVRLNDLVTDLLAFARPGSARLTPVVLRPLAEDCVTLIRSDFPGIQFEVLGDGAAMADPNLVRQILLNLLTNAAQAQEGSGQVRIELEHGKARVSDDGPGVSAELAARIFKPFETTKTRGTGLGLAISHRAARSMDGDLVLAEGPLSGACFELRLGPVR